MNLRQFYLTKLAEEAVEVSQRALKQAQFGAYEIQKGQEKTNRDRLLEELIDMATVVGILLDTGEIPSTEFEYRQNMRAKKIEKLKKYLQYSRGLGHVDEDNSADI